MKVPFIDLTRFEPGFLNEINEKLSSMLMKAQFIGGAEVSLLETRLQERLGVANVITCANGTDALQLALRALGVGRGDVVLVPNVTFWATFEAVVNVGANPSTVDVDLSDAGVDLNALEQAIQVAKPKAVIIAHLYGWGSAHLNKIREVCQTHGIFLLEDGAQSFGALYQNESICKGALISTTSFYPAKVLGGAGDGGAVFTNDPNLADKVRRLGNHGRSTHYGYSDVGWNSRLDSLQAAYLNLSLDYIDQRLESRRRTARSYQVRLPELGIEVLNPPKSYKENGYCNTCLIRDADLKTSLESALKLAEVGFGNIYPGALSKQAGAEGFNLANFGLNNSEILCSSVLNLPLFPYMTDDEVDYVIHIVKLAMKK